MIKFVVGEKRGAALESGLWALGIEIAKQKGFISEHQGLWDIERRKKRLRDLEEHEGLLWSMVIQFQEKSAKKRRR